ncbi:MAG: hypothetical protein JWR52_947 [Marmoricola sp.]|nr:hypothetical protein [Marmoricola sp.]
MAESDASVTRLILVPDVPKPNQELGLPCKRPTCSNLAERDRAGRPTDFCSGPGNCQLTYQAERKRAKRQLAEAVDIAERYEWSVALQVESAVKSGTRSQSPPQKAQTASTPAPLTSASAGGQPQPAPVDWADNLLVSLLHEVGLTLGALQTASRQDADPADIPHHVARAIERLERARTSAFEGLAALEP